MGKSVWAGVTKPDYSIPDGIYPARLFQIIQLGSQRFEKNGKEWFSPMIMIGFELPTLTYETKDGTILSNIKSTSCFLSMNQSRNGVIGLREIVDGLRGSSEYSEEELEKFDVASFLGKECMLTLSGVESRGVVYQNITKIEGCEFTKNGLEIGSYRTPLLVTTDDFANLETFDIPSWIKDKIIASEEWKQANLPTMPNGQYMPEEKEEIRIEDVPFD
jgi:hypothetical protein